MNPDNSKFGCVALRGREDDESIFCASARATWRWREATCNYAVLW